MIKFPTTTLFFLAILLAAFPLFARHVSERTHKMILATLKEAQGGVYDYNGDGLVNCIDYTCLFKLAWDKNYPERKNDCGIVRNYNENTGMHHLFIRVFDDNHREIEVEPWAENKRRYLMRQNWDSKYNPKFNIYGETAKWLNTKKQRKRA